MTSCGLRPADRRSFARAVERDLERRYGKRRYYSPNHVRHSARSLGYPVDWHCWAMCLFTNPIDFRRLHESIGEVCDYAAMKAEMTSALDGSWLSGLELGWPDWLHWPDLDLDVFGWFD